MESKFEHFARIKKEYKHKCEFDQFCLEDMPCYKHQCKMCLKFAKNMNICDDCNKLKCQYLSCCQYSPCYQRKILNGQRCITHQCLACIYFKTYHNYNNASDLVCEKHSCSEPNCKNIVKFTDSTKDKCEFHILRDVNIKNHNECHYNNICHLQSFNKSNYCRKHKCNFSGCHNPKKNNSKYCISHQNRISLCHFKRCSNLKIPNSNACQIHRCHHINSKNNIQCGQIITSVDDSQLCFKHCCHFGSCPNHPLFGFSFCQKHKCSENYCKSKMHENNLCQHHFDIDQPNFKNKVKNVINSQM